jgi:hypothetical protein
LLLTREGRQRKGRMKAGEERVERRGRREKERVYRPATAGVAESMFLGCDGGRKGGR